MTFLEMQDLVLSWLDDPDAGYFTRPQVKVWLNNAQKEAQKDVEQAFEGHFVKCVQTQTVINQREYDLPTDFKRTRRLTIILSGTSFPNENILLLYKITPNTQDAYDQSGVPSVYYFKGNQIILVACPNQAWPLRMEYIYRIPDLVSDSDVSEIPLDYHEYVCLLAARDGFLKDGRDISPIKQKIDDYQTALKRDAEERNIDAPRRVTPVQFDNGDYDNWFGF